MIGIAKQINMIVFCKTKVTRPKVHSFVSLSSEHEFSHNSTPPQHAIPISINPIQIIVHMYTGISLSED
tara:strand:- start:32 stop:238 length:207 start_codon:yes stop_codon:yes gene_type:complete